MTELRSVAVTTGEPAGIGPEVSLKAAAAVSDPILLIGDRTLLEAEARRLGIAWPLPAHVSIRHVQLRAPAVPFTGHTEFFQDLCGVRRVVMMLTSNARTDAMKVALATTHLPIARLSEAITGELLDEVLDTLNTALARDYGLAEPRILVTGLNPHAGENGHMGHEEINTITPALERARSRGIHADGPVPADTAFVPGHWDRYDAVLCMYHDQGLPVLKHVGFAEGVNVTLGLPYIRTSVDHGTALDIAGQGKADDTSMISALRLAHFLSKNRETRMA